MNKILVLIILFLAASPLVQASSLSERLAGRILLDVQNHGEAWYVDPVTLTRIYLGRPEDAWRLMTAHGLGITMNDLASIPKAEILNVDNSVIQDVPFTPQAPLGDWSDPKQQDGCEEATALMAYAWVNNSPLAPEEARDMIVAMSNWEEQNFGYYIDTSINDTAERLMKSYLGLDVQVVSNEATLTDIKQTVLAGKLVALPINGQLMQPFYYTPPGPERHMILIVGYDPGRDIFTAHDPGTSQGQSLEITSGTIETMWRDYASGKKVPIPSLPKSFITINK